MRKYYATNKELSKILNDITKARIKCPSCGHSILIPPKEDKCLCNWCGKYVFKDKQAEFKYKVKEKQIKEKRLGNENRRNKEDEHL